MIATNPDPAADSRGLASGNSAAQSDTPIRSNIRAPNQEAHPNISPVHRDPAAAGGLTLPETLARCRFFLLVIGIVGATNIFGRSGITGQTEDSGHPTNTARKSKGQAERTSCANCDNDVLGITNGCLAHGNGEVTKGQRDDRLPTTITTYVLYS